ncbi:UPF0014 family, partial [Gorgonomyces haynaldii]
NVAVAGSFLISSCLLSLRLGLKLETAVIVAAIRCSVQLTILAGILKPVLETDNPLIIFGMGLFQLLLSFGEIMYIRASKVHRHMIWTVAISNTASVLVIIFLGNQFSLRTSPWYAPREFVPIFGMITGNAMTSVAVTMNTFLQMVVDRKDMIEMYLSYGASGWECLQPIVVHSLGMGLLPSINQMAITGLVTIPGGLLTGQLLAGADPYNATRYQQIIMFMMNSACTLACVMTAMFASVILIDDHCRLRVDLISKSNKLPSFKDL